MVIDKTSQCGTERWAVTGTRWIPQWAVWQEGHADTWADGVNLERKREVVEVQKKMETGWGGEETDEQARGKAAELGKYECVSSSEMLLTHAMGSRFLLAFTTHTAVQPGSLGASDTKVDAWNPWCPDPPTDRHSLVLHLTLRIPFLPLCISKNLGDSYMQF